MKLPYISLSCPTRREWKFVATTPGRRARTRMLVPVSSLRRAFVKASWAALFEWYTASPGNGGTSRPVTDVTLRIVPSFRLIMDELRTAYVTNMIPLMFVLFMVTISDTLRSGNAAGAPRASPACYFYLALASVRIWMACIALDDHSHYLSKYQWCQSLLRSRQRHPQQLHSFADRRPCMSPLRLDGPFGDPPWLLAVCPSLKLELARWLRQISAWLTFDRANKATFAPSTVTLRASASPIPMEAPVFSQC